MKLLRVRKPWVNPLRRKSPFFVAATTFTKSAKTTLCSVQLSHYCFFFFHFPFFDEVVGRKLVREQKHCCYCYYSCCCYQALSQLLTTFGQKGLKRASNPAYLPFYLMEKRKLSSFWLLPLCVLTSVAVVAVENGSKKFALNVHVYGFMVIPSQ